MKIGIVCPYDLFRPGGVQEHVLAEFKALQKRGHSVKIITPQPRKYRGAIPKDWIFLGQSTKLNTIQDTTLEVSAAVDLLSVDQMFDKEKFDLVQFHEPLVPLLARQLLSRCPAVKIGTFHAAMPDTMLSKTIAGPTALYVKSILKYLDVITAVAPPATDYIGPYVENKPVHLITNGIDLTKYSISKKVTRDKATITFIGRLEKRKGVSYLIKAYAELQKTMPELKLKIAGSGPERRKLEYLAASLDVENVEFLGFVSELQKRQLLRECSVFCSPALYGESFGIVLLEAMAVGAPVIAGDNPGYTHLLKERGSIGIVNPKDISTFARHLKFLIEDYELRKLWQSWAKSYIKQFSYDRIIDQYVELFEEAIE